jgi:hypothetical protein
VSILGISKLGIEGDGVITLVLAIAGAIVLFVSTGVLGHQRTPGKVSTWALVILAVLVALVGLLDMNGAAALGLYLTFFAGIGWVVGAIWHLNANKAQAEPTSDQA